MPEKPSIAVVGTGNLGSALVIALHEAGFLIDALIAHARGMVRARQLARQIGSRALLSPKHVNAPIFWLCVPDREIVRAAASLADTVNWHGKIALHSSGALSSDELEPLRKKGASVASVHPLMTFVRRSRASLAGVPFAIEGDREAVRAARSIVRHLGGQPNAIKKKDKGAYHAWGTFASPLLTALLATTERVAALAGVPSRVARRRMLPILLQTVANYGSLGPAAGFSGPVIRGDVDTVKRHLRVLRGSPAREVYLALVRAALRYLPVRARKSMARVIDPS